LAQCLDIPKLEKTNGTRDEKDFRSRILLTYRSGLEFAPHDVRFCTGREMVMKKRADD